MERVKDEKSLWLCTSVLLHDIMEYREYACFQVSLTKCTDHQSKNVHFQRFFINYSTNIIIRTIHANVMQKDF